MGCARFFRKMMSDVTSVPAMALNAVLGRRSAPMNSARLAMYFRTEESPLSIVPLVVIYAIMPPGFVRSMDLAMK